MNFDKFEKLENRLLERIEISATFDVSHSSFNRREAATLVAKEAKFNPDSVYTIKLSHRAGLKKVKVGFQDFIRVKIRHVATLVER